MIEVRPDDWRDQLAIERNADRAEIGIGYGTVRVVFPQYALGAVINRLEGLKEQIGIDRANDAAAGDVPE